MASKDISEISMSETLECSVCLSTYNLTNRLPKALSCHHTICSRCVDQVKKGPTIKCPTCRKKSTVVQVAVNFAVTDVLRALCEECTGQKQVGTCVHCNQQLCSKCQESHAINYHKDLVKQLSKLDTTIGEAFDVSKDNTALVKENEKEKRECEKIKEAIQQIRAELDQLEKSLEESVKQAKDKNIRQYLSWNKSLDTAISHSKYFSFDAKNQIGAKYTKRISIEEMTRMTDKCDKFIEELNELQNNQPTLDDYMFVRADKEIDPLSVGKIMVQNHNVNIPDYTTLRYKSLTGSQGSQIHQFDRPASVACSSDHIIVADQRNHRIKWYDYSLNLKFIVGENGSGPRQFCYPDGLSIGPGEQVYVSDLHNHRIMVLSKRGEYLREFGSKGTGDNQFNGPRGIAISGSEMFICDSHNYCVKVVRTDRSFVEHIGSKGTAPGQFQDFCIGVAVMSAGDGRVLVNELNKKQLHVYNRAGAYQGLFPSTIPKELSRSIPVSGLTVDEYDNVLIPYNTNQLVVYNKDGDLITVIGSEGQQPGLFNGPRAVAVNMRGEVVVTEVINQRIQLFTFNSKSQE